MKQTKCISGTCFNVAGQKKAVRNAETVQHTQIDEARVGNLYTEFFIICSKEIVLYIIRTVIIQSPSAVVKSFSKLTL
jgi:hypothetical protein